MKKTALAEHPRLQMLLMALATGVMCFFLAWPSAPAWPIAFTMTPLWYSWLNEKRHGMIFLTGWIAQAVCATLSFYWLRHTADTFFAATGLLSWVFLLAFASVAMLNIPLAGLCWSILRSRLRLSLNQELVLLVLLATLLEVVFPKGFPFSPTHALLTNEIPIFHFADWLGFAGLSIVPFTMSAIFVHAVVDWKRGRRYALAGGIGANLVLGIVLSAAGIWHKNQMTKPDSSIRVHLFQSFVLPIEMLQMRLGHDRAVETTLDYFFHNQMIQPISPQPDLVIWSETAIPFDIAHDSEPLRVLQDYVRRGQIPMIAGAYRYNDAKVKHNSVVLFDRDGRPGQYYDKRILMPFGEYLPGESYFPSIRELAPQTPMYGEGQDSKPIVVGDARFGPTICYEAVFTDFFRPLTEAGANILLNVSSDYWFGPYLEPDQHFTLARSRAVEYGRPLVRVVDSGISAVIAADGAKIASAPIWELWQKAVDVPFVKNPDRTFYDLYGAWIPFALLASVIALAVQGRPRKSR